MRLLERDDDRQARPAATPPGHAPGRAIAAHDTRAVRKRPDGAPLQEMPAVTKGRLPAWPVTFFVISLFLPWIMHVGDLAMGPFRFVLIATVLPCLFKWASGGAGRHRTADYVLLFFCVWSTISLSVRQGLGPALQSGGILFIETAGAYFLSRCYIRTADDLYNLILLFFRIILFLLPFTIIETVSGRNVLLDSMRMVFTTHPNLYDTRWGLRRVQGIMEHPILFGVVVGSVLAPVHLVLGYGQTAIRRYWKTAVVFVSAFLSMSSGPISGLFAQLALIAWDGILSTISIRWKLLWVALVINYVIVALGSNQSVFQFFITHFSFSPENAYYRVLIWEFGSGSVMNHPLFGTPMNGWDRPLWMPPSIDMFWLYNAILYGMPSGFAMITAFLSIFATVSFRKINDPRLLACRLGFLASMTGFFLVGWTVHFWNVTYVLFLFSLGSGVWLLDASSKPEAGRRDTTAAPPSGRERSPTRMRASSAPRRRATARGSDDRNS